jgi:hypothetical protein
MRYRIKQIDENTFIPQCKPRWYFGWGNIDRVSNYVWQLISFHSQCKSLESANTTIERHKSYLKLEKQYPKYFKV